MKLYSHTVTATHWKKKTPNWSTLDTTIDNWFFNGCYPSEFEWVRYNLSGQNKIIFFANMPLLYAGMFAQAVFQVCKSLWRALKNPFTLSSHHCSISFRWLSHLVTSHHRLFILFSFFECSPESGLRLCLSFFHSPSQQSLFFFLVNFALVIFFTA